MRWPGGRFSPAMLVALLTSVLILIGFLLFLFFGNRPTSVDVSVDLRATPTRVVLSSPAPVAESPPPTLVGLPTPTSAPVANVKPEPTLAPTATATVRPTTPPATPPAAAPAAAAPAAPAGPSGPAPAAPDAPSEESAPDAPAEEGAPGAAPPAAPPPAQPAAQAPAIPPKPAPAPPAPPPVAEPSGRGGFGNTQRDFQATYGPPIGRTPDGHEIYATERADLQVGFQNGRAVRLRFVLRDGRVTAIDEMRALERRFNPTDAQPVSSSGEATGRPVDQFRSAALASLFPSAEAGVFSAAYTPADQDRFSGFELQLGRRAS
jgi:hypothetical protein